MRNELTRQDSQAIKGIAIWMMLAHHLFYSRESFGDMPVEFFILNTDLVISLARFAKICVPLFVFVTAYGLAVKYKSQEWSRIRIGEITAQRYVALMIPFWFVFLVMQIVCNIAGSRTFTQVYGNGRGSLLYFLFDALGLAHCQGTPTLNATWWYMSLALLLIFLMPFLWRGVFCAGAAMFFGCFILFRSADWSNTGYFNYILVALLGAAACEMDLFSRLGHFLQGRSRLIRVLLFFAAVVGLGCCWMLNREGGYQDMVFCIATLLVVFLQQQYFGRLGWLTAFLAFFGRHSMNLFLLHTFVKTYLLHDFIYSFRYGILIWIGLMAVSLAMSYIIMAMEKVVKLDVLQKKLMERIRPA